MITHTSLTVPFAILEGLAIMLGLFRLVIRLNIRRFWWEDMWAVVVVACGVSFLVVTTVYFETQSYEATYITSWFASYTFTSTVWAVRMSLLYSIIRLTLPATPLRKVSLVIALAFVMIWATLIALKTRWCISGANVKSPLSRPACPVSHATAIFEVTTDCTADASLVALSLKLLWRVKLPRRQRRMILCLFSSTAIMSVISLVHASSELVPVTLFRYVLTDLELLISLIMCNLLVVVTYIYRVTQRSPDGEFSDSESSTTDDDDFTTPIPTSTQCLTTVNLSTFDSSIMQGTETASA